MGRQGGGVQREQEDERLLKDTRLAAQADQPDCSKEAQDGGGGSGDGDGGGGNDGNGSGSGGGGSGDDDGGGGNDGNGGGGGGGEARHATTETARGYTHTQIITPKNPTSSGTNPHQHPNTYTREHRGEGGQARHDHNHRYQGGKQHGAARANTNRKRMKAKPNQTTIVKREGRD